MPMPWTFTNASPSASSSPLSAASSKRACCATSPAACVTTFAAVRASISWKQKMKTSGCLLG
eukprot:CAMPEP_0115719228 /NCGR_PEP_ID=MMETSP0272-20121206/77864_1 /TAXON_ID=71861 /ORGANISM="Scrippsiella trochoidea, Strain CCMP3099" /LENGTH=61 /DNA_ID=CAMNT_0003161833 /DNA_START=39 /DNA_END=221 /DNA_ORIENTATION=+